MNPADKVSNTSEGVTNVAAMGGRQGLPSVRNPEKHEKHETVEREVFAEEKSWHSFVLRACGNLIDSGDEMN